MSETTDRLREQLIRNFDEIGKTREERAPLYDTLCARLGRGTAATKLGISIDVVAPGKRGCPYHFHHAQEEAFVILEGRGTLRVAGEPTCGSFRRRPEAPSARGRGSARGRRACPRRC